MSINVDTLAKKLAGKFLVFDGPDGAGKSTQSRLLADRLKPAGVEVVSCRDPGGTEIGDSETVFARVLECLASVTG